MSGHAQKWANPSTILPGNHLNCDRLQPCWSYQQTLETDFIKWLYLNWIIQFLFGILHVHAKEAYLIYI